MADLISAVKQADAESVTAILKYLRQYGCGATLALLLHGWCTLTPLLGCRGRVALGITGSGATSTR